MANNWCLFFFGLLSCRIYLDLKAALFNTLSAFTKTSQIAIHFWKIIEEIDVKKRKELFDFFK